MPKAILHDPLLIFKYRLYLIDSDAPDKPVAGLMKMGAIKQKVENISWRDAGHPKNSASQISGGTTYEPITFEQGLGLDDGRFESWALAVSNWKEGDGAHDKAAFRQNLQVELLDLSGKPQLTYVIENAWVSEYQALPELDANNMNTVGISSFTCQFEGWYRQE